MPKYSQDDLLNAAVSGNELIMQKCFDEGVNVNCVDHGGDTPLHYAVEHCNPLSVSMLLAHGANPNAQDEDGWTPLHHAAWRADTDDNVETVKMLLKSGANAKIANAEGKTPLAIFCEENREIIDCWNLLKERS